MRSSTTLVLAMVAVTACRGTEGDILRTKSDAGTRPQPQPLSSWQIQLTGTLAQR